MQNQGGINSSVSATSHGFCGWLKCNIERLHLPSGYKAVMSGLFSLIMSAYIEFTVLEYGSYSAARLLAKVDSQKGPELG